MPNTYFAGRAEYDDKRDFIVFTRLFLEEHQIRFDATTSWEGVHNVAHLSAAVATRKGDTYETELIRYLDATKRLTHRMCRLRLKVLSQNLNELEIEGAWVEGAEHPFYGNLKRDGPPSAHRHGEA